MRLYLNITQFILIQLFYSLFFDSSKYLEVFFFSYWKLEKREC